MVSVYIGRFAKAPHFVSNLLHATYNPLLHVDSLFLPQCIIHNRRQKHEGENQKRSRLRHLKAIEVRVGKDLHKKCKNQSKATPNDKSPSDRIGNHEKAALKSVSNIEKPKDVKSMCSSISHPLKPLASPEIPLERTFETPFETKPELPMENKPQNPSEVNPKDPLVITCVQNLKPVPESELKSSRGEMEKASDVTKDRQHLKAKAICLTKLVYDSRTGMVKSIQKEVGPLRDKSLLHSVPPASVSEIKNFDGDKESTDPTKSYLKESDKKTEESIIFIKDQSNSKPIPTSKNGNVADVSSEHSKSKMLEDAVEDQKNSGLNEEKCTKEIYNMNNTNNESMSNYEADQSSNSTEMLKEKDFENSAFNDTKTCDKTNLDAMSFSKTVYNPETGVMSSLPSQDLNLHSVATYASENDGHNVENDQKSTVAFEEKKFLEHAENHNTSKKSELHIDEHEHAESSVSDIKIETQDSGPTKEPFLIEKSNQETILEVMPMKMDLETPIEQPISEANEEPILNENINSETLSDATTEKADKETSDEKYISDSVQESGVAEEAQIYSQNSQPNIKATDDNDSNSFGIYSTIDSMNTVIASKEEKEEGETELVKAGEIFTASDLKKDINETSSTEMLQKEKTSLKDEKVSREIEQIKPEFMKIDSKSYDNPSDLKKVDATERSISSEKPKLNEGELNMNLVLKDPEDHEPLKPKPKSKATLAQYLYEKIVGMGKSKSKDKKNLPSSGTKRSMVTFSCAYAHPYIITKIEYKKCVYKRGLQISSSSQPLSPNSNSENTEPGLQAANSRIRNVYLRGMSIKVKRTSKQMPRRSHGNTNAMLLKQSTPTLEAYRRGMYLGHSSHSDVEDNALELLETSEKSCETEIKIQGGLKPTSKMRLYVLESSHKESKKQENSNSSDSKIEIKGGIPPRLSRRKHKIRQEELEATDIKILGGKPDSRAIIREENEEDISKVNNNTSKSNFSTTTINEGNDRNVSKGVVNTKSSTTTLSKMLWIHR